MKYPIYNKKARFALGCIDQLLRLLPTKRINPRLDSLLLCNTAHLGDVVLTTSLLAPLKQAFPKMKIGMLVNSKSAVCIQDHPLVDAIHHFDHWKISEGNYFNSRRRALKEIRDYQIACDCNFHFPNSSPLLWQAGIPTRIGFESAGFGPLLTHALPWQPESTPAPLIFWRLLSFLGDLPQPTKPSLVHRAKAKKEQIVIHMGSRNPAKEWSLDNWRLLIKQLEGHSLLFTGAGKREKAAIESVIPSSARNLADQLSWSEFVDTIQESSLLIGVDSVAGHVAAAVDTPAVLIYSSTHPKKLWEPFGGKNRVLRSNPSCSACLKGCHAMHCMNMVEVDRVYEAVQAMRPRPTSPLCNFSTS